MNYYKLNSNVFAYSDEQVAQGFASDKVLMSTAEVEAHINPVISTKQIAKQAKFAVYALLDQTAQQYDYRNFAEVSQFLSSGTWKAEAEALLAWQDEVWIKAYEALEEPIESVDGFVAQLPKFVSKPD